MWELQILNDWFDIKKKKDHPCHFVYFVRRLCDIFFFLRKEKSLLKFNYWVVPVCVPVFYM